MTGSEHLRPQNVRDPYIVQAAVLEIGEIEFQVWLVSID